MSRINLAKLINLCYSGAAWGNPLCTCYAHSMNYYRTKQELQDWWIMTREQKLEALKKLEGGYED